MTFENEENTISERNGGRNRPTEGE